MDPMASVLSSVQTNSVPMSISNHQILAALAGQSSDTYQARVSDTLVIKSQFLQGVQPRMEDTLERGISDQERIDRFHGNEKLIYTFSILDKVITALAEHPDKAWPMRFFLTDVLAVLNAAPYKSTQFFLLAHLAFRYDQVIEIFHQTVHFEPSQEVEGFLLPTSAHPDGRELSLMEGIFLEKWIADFHAWVRSPAVIFA